jgi:hypothetical protein
MDYPSRKRKSGTPTAERNEIDDRLDLRLAEYSAPFGEEMPWREATDDLPGLLEACRVLRPERGSLH